MLALAKDVNQQYPELIEAGGFHRALELALRDSGSPHAVVRRNLNIGVLCARVEGERRRCQAYIVEQQRLFVFDLWMNDFILVSATAGSIKYLAGRIHKWLSSTCPARDVVTNLERVTVKDDGMVYEAREEVDEAWQDMSNAVPSLRAFVREAAAREKLRQLFPYGGGFSVGFSLCTRYPFTEDIPVVWPSKDGQFRVMDSSSQNVLGRGDAAHAADLVVSHLPSYCGPAVAGTAGSL